MSREAYIGADPYVAIRLRNVGDVVAKQGGTFGNIAFSAAPQTITNEVYSKIRDKVAAALSAEGVDADVGVFTLPGGKPGASSDLGRGILFGAALVVAGLFVYKAVSK